MKSYWSAISTAAQLGSAHDIKLAPGKFIIWAEDICELLASIYERDYDTVTEDLFEKVKELDDE